MDLLTVGTWLLAIAAIAALYFQFNELKDSRRQFHEQTAKSHQEFISTLKADHKQRRLEAALRLWNDWDMTFDKEKRRSMLTFIKWIETETDNDSKNDLVSFFVQGGRVSRQRLKDAKISDAMKEIFLSEGKERLSVSDIEEMRTALVTFLNVMEKVAVAYQYHIADQEILNAAFKDNIVKLTTELNSFIIEYRRYFAPGTWVVLTDLVFHGEWMPKAKHEASRKSADQSADEI